MRILFFMIFEIIKCFNIEMFLWRYEFGYFDVFFYFFVVMWCINVVGRFLFFLKYKDLWYSFRSRLK